MFFFIKNNCQQEYSLQLTRTIKKTFLINNDLKQFAIIQLQISILSDKDYIQWGKMLQSKKKDIQKIMNNSIMLFPLINSSVRKEPFTTVKNVCSKKNENIQK